MNYRKLNNDITDVVLKGLHYINNLPAQPSSFDEVVSHMEYLDAQAIELYMNDGMYHAKVNMLVSRIMEVVHNNDGPNVKEVLYAINNSAPQK